MRVFISDYAVFLVGNQSEEYLWKVFNARFFISGYPEKSEKSVWGEFMKNIQREFLLAIIWRGKENLHNSHECFGLVWQGKYDKWWEKQES